MNAMFLDDLQHATEITRDEFGSDRGPNGWSNEVRTSSHACSES